MNLLLFIISKCACRWSYVKNGQSEGYHNHLFLHLLAFSVFEVLLSQDDNLCVLFFNFYTWSWNYIIWPLHFIYIVLDIFNILCHIQFSTLSFLSSNSWLSAYLTDSSTKIVHGDLTCSFSVSFLIVLDYLAYATFNLLLSQFLLDWIYFYFASEIHFSNNSLIYI